MKNSLKFQMGAFCVLFFAGQARAVQYLDNSHSGIHMLKDNQHVFTFIPSDVRGIQGNAKRAIHNCDEQGNEINTMDPGRKQNIETIMRLRRGAVSAGTCATYYSPSTNTSWVISFAPNPGTAIRARKIYELRNGQLKLWATFNPMNHDKNTYASTGAQKFAERNGGRNTDVARSPDDSENNEVAQLPQPSRENCAGKNFFEKAACELKNAGVENAVGTVIKNSR